LCHLGIRSTVRQFPGIKIVASGRTHPYQGFSQVFILQWVKTLCFEEDLQVLITRNLRDEDERLTLDCGEAK
jgi:hypothetical protein